MNSKSAYLEILKEQYNFEHQREDKFDKTLPISLTILPILIVGIFYVINTYFPNGSNQIVFRIVMISLVGICVFYFFWLASLLHNIIGYKGKYKYANESEELRLKYSSINEQFSDSQYNKHELIADRLNAYQIEIFLECNQNNKEINDSRAASYHGFKLILMYIIFFASLLTAALIIEKIIGYF